MSDPAPTTTTSGATIDVATLIAKLKTYKYVATVGTTVIGPLKSAPKIEGDVETKDVSIYETGSEVQASYLTKNNVKLTLETNDVDTAIPLLAAFAKGDDILASASSKSITLVPITSDTGAKTITFPNAFLQPGLSTGLEDDETPNSVSLVYICKPATSGTNIGKPFTYA